MKLYLLATLLSLTAFACAHLIDKQRWGSETKRTNVEVIRGKNASIKDFPFMVSFKIDDEFLGSGVILNKHWILTTAFIVGWQSLSSVAIRAGSDAYDSGGKPLVPEKIVYPSSYVGDWESDIALVKTKTPMKFGKTINKIKIGSRKLQNQTKLTIAGWGSTSEDSYDASEVLTSGKVTFLDRKACSSYYEDISKLLCTFDKKVGPSVYDFGDPLILKHKVYGLFAGADDLIPGEYPMVYTDVTKYKKWIKKNIK